MIQKILETETETESDIKLLPCPFCGKDIALFTNCQEVEACETFGECPLKSHYLAVVCSCAKKGCGAASGFYPTYREAAEAWNRRAGCVSMEDVERAIKKTAVGGSKHQEERP